MPNFNDADAMLNILAERHEAFIEGGNNRVYFVTFEGIDGPGPGEVSTTEGLEDFKKSFRLLDDASFGMYRTNSSNGPSFGEVAVSECTLLIAPAAQLVDVQARYDQQNKPIHFSKVTTSSLILDGTRYFLNAEKEFKNVLITNFYEDASTGSVWLEMEAKEHFLLANQHTGSFDLRYARAG